MGLPPRNYSADSLKTDQILGWYSARAAAGTNQQITTGCTGRQENKFVVTGRGGIPQNPTQEVISDRPWSDVRDLTAYHKRQPVQAQISLTRETLLIQASSWHRNAQGKIELVNDKYSPQMEQLLTCAGISQK